MTLWRMHRHDLHRLRQEVTDDIIQLIEDMEEITQQWWHHLKPHVRQVYWDPELAQRTQIPVFLHLLKSLGYPAMMDITEDLNCGFSILRELPPGPGWRPRTDNKYSFPIDETAFRTLNNAYIDKKLRAARPDPCWNVLLQEVMQEVALGRMDGPFCGPNSWAQTCVAPPGLTLQECPDQALTASVSFSVTQTDKVRRCEDFRRSHHNDLLLVKDTPNHHDISTHITMSWAFFQEQEQRTTWCQDLNSAYRQWPLRTPSDAFTLLICPFGATLWRHNCLPFGAAGSVWSFNRAGDAMSFASRRLWLAPITHYVDDCSCTEAESTNQSSYEAFETTFKHLGLRMKPKKAQPPSTKQKILGVILYHGPQEVEVQPCPERARRMTIQLQTILDSNQLEPDAAHRLAGKLLFLQSSSFGQVGRATLGPIYARAANNQPDPRNQLTHALRTALRTVIALINNTEPRRVPFNPTVHTVVLYTDAFFKQGERVYKIGNPNIPQRWSVNNCHRYLNGWGYVVTIGGATFYEHGQVPSQVLRKFCSRRAYIYFLEILAHFLAIFATRRMGSSNVLAYIDNKAGHSALVKGYGRDPTINNLLAYFWNYNHVLQLNTHFEWVCSANNISDEVSRGSFQTAQQLGWTQLHTDFSAFYDILIKASEDLEYAAASAAYDLLSINHASH